MAVLCLLMGWTRAYYQEFTEMSFCQRRTCAQFFASDSGVLDTLFTKSVLFADTKSDFIWIDYTFRKFLMLKLEPNGHHTAELNLPLYIMPYTMYSTFCKCNNERSSNMSHDIGFSSYVFTVSRSMKVITF
jgi:hypothetical protein